MGLLCDREVYARKPLWQWLVRSQITYIKRKSRLEKKLVFSQVIMPHQDEDDEEHSTVEDEVAEFDSSSDEESCAGEALV